MRMKRVLFIVNFTSGMRTIRSRLPQILEVLGERDCLVTVYPLVPSKGLVAENIIAAYADEYDCILCCGGDGTLNHVLNEIMSAGLDIPIGYIPSGSTNDFSKSLTNGVKYTDTQLASAVADGDDFRYDIGKANARYFNYVAAFGAFTAISYETPQDLKNSLGYLAYILNTIGRLSENLSYKVHMRIEHDGGTEEGDYIFGSVSNSISVAGMESPLLSNVRLDDGLMEVSLIKAPAKFADTNAIVSDIAAGKIQHDNVRMFKTHHIRFVADEPVVWTLDGEAGGSYKTTDIEVISKAICMKVPRKHTL